MEARKNRVGKVVTTMMALVLTFMFVLTPVEALAQTTRGDLCTTCNYGEMVKQPTKYTNWGTSTDKYPCFHGFKQGYDLIRMRYRIEGYKCNNCGEKIETWYTERERLCHGYN